MAEHSPEQKMRLCRLTLSSIPLYGDDIAAQSDLRFDSTQNGIPTFGFAKDTTVRKEYQKVCYEIFLEYFPDGMIKDRI